MGIHDSEGIEREGKSSMDASSAFAQAARVHEMCRLLQQFLDGEMTRHEIAIWCHDIWPPGSGQGGPFRRYGDASSIFDSILNVEETESPGKYVVRETEVAAYVELLRSGSIFLGEEHPLADFESGWEEITRATPAVRYWQDGLGWFEHVHFSAAHNGRPFVAARPLDPERRLGASSWGVVMRRGDDWTAALRDLFEELGVDDDDALQIAPNTRIAELQQWSVWRLDDNGQSIEMTTCRSYAKAMRIQQEMENRGHKQTYWVDETTSRAD